jgi:hypothetical protein
MSYCERFYDFNDFNGFNDFLSVIPARHSEPARSGEAGGSAISVVHFFRRPLSNKLQCFSGCPQDSMDVG